MRWGVEENYKWHKVTLELENFSGYSELAIEQEFFALVFTANIASLLMQEAEEELEKENRVKGFKYSYKVNKRIAISALKDELIVNMLDPDFDVEIFCERLKTEFRRSLCPVRLNRKYERQKKLRLRHGCTSRRCI